MTRKNCETGEEFILLASGMRRFYRCKMMYQLALPKDEHAAQIAAIWEAGWHEAHDDIVPRALWELRTAKSFYDRTKRNLDSTRIACSNGDVLGFCMIKENELYQMYVSPDARGTGAAQALITDAEQRILEKGYKTAWLACAVGNERAKRFYEKMGWLNSGREIVELDTIEGAFPLEVWRFEKQLA